MLLTIASTIFVLGILIFIHELGHFLVAKKVGVKVDRFSLGFPPNVVSKQVGETTYCIGVIPLGGYVKMAGENPQDETTGQPHEFMSKSVPQRAAVILAGPFMNYLLSIALLISIIYFGGQPLFDETRILVGEVSQKGPAGEAGLMPGDQIIAIDGEPVSDFDSLRNRISVRVREPITLTWLRDQDTIRATMETEAMPRLGPDGNVDTVGIIGFSQKVIGRRNVGLWESARDGFVTAHIIVWETAKIVKKAVTLEISLKMIGGPVFIAKQSGKEARKGVASLLFFMALLSVNLAVLNMLPIPILDGGHLVFLAIERVRGSPLSVRARAVAQQIGLAFLLALILMVTYNDVLRVIRGF